IFDQALGGWQFTRSLAASKIYKIPYFPDCPGLPTQQILNVPNSNPNFPSSSFLVYDTFGANSQVPKFAISPQSRAILSSGLFPLPNSTSGCNSTIPALTEDPTNPSGPLISDPHCFNTSLSPLTTWRQELFRIDHNFTSRQKLYFRYIHDDWSTTVLS